MIRNFEFELFIQLNNFNNFNTAVINRIYLIGKFTVSH